MHLLRTLSYARCQQSRTRAEIKISSLVTATPSVTSAIGVRSRLACHARLGTPLYFVEIVFAKIQKNRKKVHF